MIGTALGFLQRPDVESSCGIDHVAGISPAMKLSLRKRSCAKKGGSDWDETKRSFHHSRSTGEPRRIRVLAARNGRKRGRSQDRRGTPPPGQSPAFEHALRRESPGFGDVVCLVMFRDSILRPSGVEVARLDRATPALA